MCSSPELFAAYHALLRLLTPRHPPCALSFLSRSDSRTASNRLSPVPVVKDRSPPRLCRRRLGLQFTVYRAPYTPDFRQCSNLASFHWPPFSTHSSSYPGGADRIRTDDLLRARQALSHLSYCPGTGCAGNPKPEIRDSLVTLPRSAPREILNPKLQIRNVSNFDIRASLVLCPWWA